MNSVLHVQGAEMPSRTAVAKELAELFKIVSHPDRIRLIEELRSGEKDVNSLANGLNLPSTRVSQHLSLMRAHRFVSEERNGRRHFYYLMQPELADWIIEGLDFIEGRLAGLSPADINEARTLWSAKGPSSHTRTSHEEDTPHA
ncbi:MAG: metalloregulator ArsR/SmtB family transcription factor [Pseudomonadota bacterium]